MAKTRKKRNTRGQGTVYERNGSWWCDYSVDGVRKRESCETKHREEAVAYLNRKQGRIASGELLTPDRVTVRDLVTLVLEDYEIRQVAQLYIATLKVNSILLPKLGDIKATKLSSTRIKEFIAGRLKSVKPATVNRELALLHRAFQLGYNQDPPLVARVPHFPKLTEDEPRKGFLKPVSYQKLLFELPEELRLLFVVAYHVGLRKRGTAANKVVASRFAGANDLDGGKEAKSETGTGGCSYLRRHGQVHRNAAADQ